MFQEKTWAYLTIKQLLEKAELSDNSTAVLEMKQTALELSLKVRFKFLTFNDLSVFLKSMFYLCFNVCSYVQDFLHVAMIVWINGYERAMREYRDQTCFFMH